MIRKGILYPDMFSQILNPETFIFMIPITAIVLGHFRKMAMIKQKRTSEIQKQLDFKFHQMNQEINQLRERINFIVLSVDDISTIQKNSPVLNKETGNH